VVTLLDRILIGIRQQLEGELSSDSAITSIYQIPRLALSINLADFRDAWSGFNPLGDPIAAYRFQQLVDPIPALDHEYTGSSSIEQRYGQIIQGASAPVESLYMTSILAEAKREFDMSGQSNLSTQDEWRIVEALPDDWYTAKKDRYSWLELPLDGPEPDAGGISFEEKPSKLMLRLGDQNQVPLSEATNLTRCRLQYMFVQFNRPWMNWTLFQTAGWWLTGQPKGFCSSGRSDENRGVLPLITTGMVITRAIEFEGWDPTDQARIANAFDAGHDVHVGPFRLSKPDESVASVNIVAWRSELVAFSPQSTTPTLRWIGKTEQELSNNLSKSFGNSIILKIENYTDIDLQKKYEDKKYGIYTDVPRSTVPAQSSQGFSASQELLSGPSGWLVYSFNDQHNVMLYWEDFWSATNKGCMSFIPVTVSLTRKNLEKYAKEENIIGTQGDFICDATIGSGFVKAVFRYTIMPKIIS